MKQSTNLLLIFLSALAVSSPASAYEVTISSGGPISVGESISLPLFLEVGPGEGAVQSLEFLFEVDPAVINITTLSLGPALTGLNGGGGPDIAVLEADNCGDQSEFRGSYIFSLTEADSLGEGSHYVLDIEILGTGVGISSVNFLPSTSCGAGSTLIISAGFGHIPDQTIGSVTVLDYQMQLPDVAVDSPLPQTATLPLEIVVPPGFDPVMGFEGTIQTDAANAQIMDVRQGPAIMALNAGSGPDFASIITDPCADGSEASFEFTFAFDDPDEVMVLGEGTHHVLDVDVQLNNPQKTAVSFADSTNCFSSSSDFDTAVIAGNAQKIPSFKSGSIALQGVFKSSFEAGPKKVFISTQVFDGDALGSALAGDTACQVLADAQTLGGTWMAWLSDTTTSPSTRFTPNDTGYTRLDGAVVAVDFADLTDGEISALINVNELGVAVTNSNALKAWTATGIDGTYLGSSCTDWTSTDNTGRIGSSLDETLGTPSWWTTRGSNACTAQFPLYCFEQ